MLCEVLVVSRWVFCWVLIVWKSFSLVLGVSVVVVCSRLVVGVGLGLMVISSC